MTRKNLAALALASAISLGASYFQQNGSIRPDHRVGGVVGLLATGTLEGAKQGAEAGAAIGAAAGAIVGGVSGEGGSASGAAQGAAIGGL
jgi:hypothetical protein